MKSFNQILQVFLFFVALLMLMTVYRFTFMVSTYFMASYQSRRVHKLTYVEDIEQKLFLYTKEQHPYPFPFNINCESKEKLFWSRYYILGVEPIDVIHDDKGKVQFYFETYE